MVGKRHRGRPKFRNIRGKLAIDRERSRAAIPATPHRETSAKCENTLLIPIWTQTYPGKQADASGAEGPQCSMAAHAWRR